MSVSSSREAIMRSAMVTSRGSAARGVRGGGAGSRGAARDTEDAEPRARSL